MIVSLKGRNIPRNSVGDPHFLQLYSNCRFTKEGENLYSYQLGGEDLLDVFSPSEIVELVNRSLYQLEYQSKAHAKRREEQKLLEQPVKDMFRSLYPKQSYAKATDEQLQHCMRELRREK